MKSIYTELQDNRIDLEHNLYYSLIKQHYYIKFLYFRNDVFIEIYNKLYSTLYLLTL